MTEVKVLYFSVESDRNLVEREFNGKKFMSISEIKNLAESLELEYNGCTNIEDFIVGLNDEDYPYNDWVVLVFISKEEILHT